MIGTSGCWVAPCDRCGVTAETDPMHWLCEACLRGLWLANKADREWLQNRAARERVMAFEAGQRRRAS